MGGFRCIIFCQRCGALGGRRVGSRHLRNNRG
jgi:hypothetical protein